MTSVTIRADGIRTAGHLVAANVLVLDPDPFMLPRRPRAPRSPVARRPRPSRPPLDLSLANVVAGTAAAVLATAASTSLRLSGTLLGAAVVTFLATIGTAVLAGWLRHGRTQLRHGRSGARHDAGPEQRKPPPHPPSENGLRTGPDVEALPVVVAYRSGRRRWVLGGIVAGVTAVALSAAAGHPALSIHVDGSAIAEVERYVRRLLAEVGLTG